MKIAAAAAALLLAAFVTTGAAAQDADPAKMAEAQAVVAGVMPPEQRDQMVEQATRDLTGQIAASLDLDEIGDDGLVALFNAYRKDVMTAVMPTVHANMPKLSDAIAVAYTHEFSLAELKDIRAFAQTPSGKHYLSRSSAILGDPAVAAANTAYLRDVQKASAPTLEAFKAKVIAYFEAHPEVAKKVAAAAKQ
jgi:hypothetical protein